MVAIRGLAAEGAGRELVTERHRDDQRREDEPDPDQLIDEEGRKGDIAQEHARDHRRDRAPAEDPHRPADIGLGREVGAEALLFLAAGRGEAAQELGERERGQKREYPLRRDRQRQGGGDRLVQGLEHLADRDDDGDREHEAGRALRRAIAERHKTPARPARCEDRFGERAGEGHKGKPAQQGGDEALDPRQHQPGRVEHRIDEIASAGRRERADGEHAERGEEPVHAGRLCRRIAVDEARRDVAPAGVKRDREADREPDDEEDAGRRVAPDALVPAVEQEPEGRPVARQRAVDRRPQVGAEDAGRTLHQRAGEGGAAPVADLCPDLLRLDEEGAGKPLGFVDLGDGRFPLGALALDVGARLGRLLLRSRAELLEAGPGGVKSRLKLVDDLAQALPDRVDLLAQPLQVGIGEVAPGERRVLLVELELEGIELAPQRLRLDRDLERRGSLRRRVGLAEGSRRAEKAGCQDEPDENLAHRSAPLRPIAPPPAI